MNLSEEIIGDMVKRARHRAQQLYARSFLAGVSVKSGGEMREKAQRLEQLAKDFEELLQ